MRVRFRGALQIGSSQSCRTDGDGGPHGRISLQVIDSLEKPGRPIDNRPQVDNLPHTAA